MAANNLSLPDQDNLQFVQLLLELVHSHSVSTSISLLLYASHDLSKLPHSLLDFFLESNDITRIDKIDALEMAGAVILAHDENHEKFPLAYQHWRRALTLRLLDTEDNRPIYKTPLKSKSGQLSEWSTLDDLQRIEQQPAQRKIQSFLVRLRILSGRSWNAVRRYFIRPFSNFIRNQQSFDGLMSEMLDLCWITLDSFLRSDRPHESSIQEMITYIAARFVHTFRVLEIGDPKLNSENLMKLVEVVLMSDPSYMTDPKFETPIAGTSQMEVMSVMFMVLSRHPEMITEEVRLSLLQLVHRDGRDEDGYSLLHVSSRISGPEALSTIHFLVQLGADLNAVDEDGDGVLHILAFQDTSESRDATARLLVELGAHLDMVNKSGMTAADVWFQINTPEKKDVADLPDWLQEGVPKLMCLSSRVIRRHKLRYDDGAIIPAVLIPFVSLH